MRMAQKALLNVDFLRPVESNLTATAARQNKLIHLWFPTMAMVEAGQILSASLPNQDPVQPP